MRRASSVAWNRSRPQLASTYSFTSGPTASRTAATRRTSSAMTSSIGRGSPRERMATDRHLQAPETLRDPELGGGGELVALEEAEAEGRIDRHLGARTAQQAPQRLAERPGLQVPQRDVERGDGVARIAGLA